MKKFFRDIKDFKTLGQGNSLVAQWLGLSAFSVQGSGSVPGQETDPQAMWYSQNKQTEKPLSKKIIGLCETTLVHLTKVAIK